MDNYNLLTAYKMDNCDTLTTIRVVFSLDGY